MGMILKDPEFDKLQSYKRFCSIPYNRYFLYRILHIHVGKIHKKYNRKIYIKINISSYGYNGKHRIQDVLDLSTLFNTLCSWFTLYIQVQFRVVQYIQYGHSPDEGILIEELTTCILMQIHYKINSNQNLRFVFTKMYFLIPIHTSEKYHIILQHIVDFSMLIELVF